MNKEILLNIKNSLLEQNKQLVHFSKDKFFTDDYTLTTNSIGVYCIKLFNIPAYIGETTQNLRQRLSRFIKVAKNEQHETESHSLGADIIEMSKQYNIPIDTLISSCSYSYIRLRDLKFNYFKDVIFPRSTVYGTEKLTISDFTPKQITQYVENEMIKDIGPVCNRSLNGYSKNRILNSEMLNNILKNFERKVA